MDSKSSMARLTPRFAANRTVREHTKQYYLPAASAYRARSANSGAPGRQIVASRHTLDERWHKVHFGEVKVETRGAQHVFEVQVCLDDLDPTAVQVDVYADGVAGSAPVRREMKRVGTLDGAPGALVYGAAVPSGRPAADYTARVMPSCPGAAIPLEDARILWQR
jgi:starch phosphorylase